MDELLRIFFSVQFIFLCLGLAAITWTIRIVVEYFLPVKYNRFWRSLALPVLPVFLGIAAGFIGHKYPYVYPPEINTEFGQWMFFITAGGLSTLVFRVIKELLMSKITSVMTNQPSPIIPDPNAGPPPCPYPQNPRSMDPNITPGSILPDTTTIDNAATSTQDLSKPT